LKASAGIEFSGQNWKEIYAWVEKMLVAQEYQQQRKKQRGEIRAYLSKVTGLSLAQITRPIRAHARTGKVEVKVYRRQRFAAKYTPADIVLLAQVDRAHERLSGPATQCILKREYAEFGNRKFTWLAEISVAHLYTLRNGAAYRKVAAVFVPTRPSPVSIRHKLQSSDKHSGATVLWRRNSRSGSSGYAAGFDPVGTSS
jgi:hypothetical protein